MSEDHAQYINRLRARQTEKVAARTQLHRCRLQAMEPVIQFCRSLVESGDIESFRYCEENASCAIRISPDARSVLLCGGSVSVSCHHAYAARIPGQVFWKISVEAVGRKLRVFYGTTEFRDVYNFVVNCIADLKVGMDEEPAPARPHIYGTPLPAPASYRPVQAAHAANGRGEENGHRKPTEQPAA